MSKISTNLDQVIYIFAMYCRCPMFSMTPGVSFVCSADPVNDRYYPGTHCFLICPHNYQLSKHQSNILCQENGTWSITDTFRCEI